jgi:hypothetical protein
MIGRIMATDYADYTDWRADKVFEIRIRAIRVIRAAISLILGHRRAMLKLAIDDHELRATWESDTNSHDYSPMSRVGRQGN